MKVQPSDYEYKVCPHCKSKRIKPVGVHSFTPPEYSVDITGFRKTGFICGNCKRYIPDYQYNYVYDRTEMRRDIKRLQDFLAQPSNAGGDE